MKAEETISLIRKSITPSEQIEHLENYARIQIEKDRERVEEEFNQDPFISIEKVHQNTTITLD
jgi:hypothetical protein